MKFFIGLFLVLLGILGGLYCGLWWAFIGGIVSIIEQVRAPHLDSMVVALGVVRIVFAGAIGSFATFVLVFPGLALITNSR